MAHDPYSRSYWRFRDEFPDIYSDDSAYALWHRLLVLADMAWPASASLPFGVRRSSLGKLVAAELVVIQSDNRYRIKGMDAERERRSESARYAVNKRWDYERSTGRSTVRSTNGIPSRAEPRQEENAAMRPEEERAALDNLAAVLKAKGLLPPKEDDAL